MLNLVGMHDREGAHWVPGWCLVTEEIGANPENMSGGDYRNLLSPIVLLNYAYNPHGTIPTRDQYQRFAMRCANYVAHSQGCKRWIIGNETNLAHERPMGVPITPRDYAECFTLCRSEIKRVQPDAEVIVAGSGPWNVQTPYATNPSGDWITYFRDVLDATQPDGISLHTYSRSTLPASVLSEDKMDAPFQHRRSGFRAYIDYMHVIPNRLKHLPVYITEMNQNEPWQATGWLAAAYAEIDRWNCENAQQILCALPYCYIKRDQFHLQDKDDVIRELQDVYRKGYTPKSNAVTLAPGRWPRFDRAGFAEYVRDLAWHDPKPHRLFLHHTWKPTKAEWRGMATMDAMHRYYRQQVWYDAYGRKQIGWTVFPHLFVAEDGIWLMNDLRVDGAGVAGHNRGALHCELIGDYDRELPSGEALANMVVVLNTLLDVLAIRTVEFHRDFSTKSCPGRAITKEWLGEQLAGELPHQLVSQDPAVIAQKGRFWAEVVQRAIEGKDLAQADRINRSNIQLLYRLEGILKG